MSDPAPIPPLIPHPRRGEWTWPEQIAPEPQQRQPVESMGFFRVDGTHPGPAFGSVFGVDDMELLESGNNTGGENTTGGAGGGPLEKRHDMDMGCKSASSTPCSSHSQLELILGLLPPNQQLQ